jgi:hypothetical protein
MEGAQPGIQANAAYAGSKGAFPNWYVRARAGHVIRYLHDIYTLTTYRHLYGMKNSKYVCVNTKLCFTSRLCP